MTLSTGSRLGPYEIVGPVGAGGMGEVYKARDTRLDRSVAVKVLPEHVASDAAARERFEREARAISQLSHPHICVLHDVGREGATDFIVMEYLEGETLFARLGGGALPLPQALECAIQIADALDKAHRAGIVHRDLKPGNLMLTRTGIKLLDFGLAKQHSPAPLGNGEKAEGALSLPTQAKPLTEAGTLLGTFQYMAPEQVEGREADARTDIFALGAVLYETVTGRKAFEGKSQASLIAAILEREPPAIEAVQPLSPPLLNRVVRKCLAKDPAERFQSAGDLCAALRWVAEGSASPLPAPRRSQRLPWALAALGLGAALVAALAYFRGRPVETPELRLQVVTPPTTDPLSIAISPDGRSLVFAAASEGKSQLWLRPLDSVTAQPLPGTDGGAFPFWSPDSRSLGFFADGKLKRIDIAGGPAQTVAAALSGRGGAWSRDGVIVFSTAASTPLYRLPAGGGEAAPLTRLDPPRQSNHRFPHVLPDGKHVLFYAQGDAEGRGVYVGSLDSPEARRLLDTEVAAVPGPSGHLLFVRQGMLVAQKFDATRRELVGDALTLAEQVTFDPAVNAGGFSAASTGAIAYRTGAPVKRQLQWFDRSGKEVGSAGTADPAIPVSPELSPDGRRVAVRRTLGGNQDIWLLEVGRGVLTRFTFDAASEQAAIWSPDGSRVVFSSNRKGVMDLYQKLASGAGAEEPLLQSAEPKNPMDWSRDGRFILYRPNDPKTGLDLWALPLAGDRQPLPVANTIFEEREGQFSPDGRFVAYQSNESGRVEVYVQPFPGPGGKWQVSTEGGGQPRWRGDGRELFYIAPDGKLMAAPILKAARENALEAGTPVALFPTRIFGGGPTAPGVTKHQYAVTPDGRRFLLSVTTGEAVTSPITLIFNWKQGARP